MNGVFSVRGKPFRLDVTAAAQQRLVQRPEPLCLELELYFSCLVRKRVHVRRAPPLDDYIPLNDWLLVRFRPVVTRTCAVSDCDGGGPPLMDMPVVRPERFFPHWLRLGYRHGEWHAEFGYAGA
jgi:hypothetical protein